MRKFVIAAALVTLASPTFAPVRAADWPTYHGDNTRQGNDSTDPALHAPAHYWTSPSLDGSIYGQPLMVGGRVIVGTENNTVYSLSPTTGAVQWSKHIGTPRTANFPCGNINPLGITGTPVYDGGYVYVLAEIQQTSTSFFFDLVKLDPSNGNIIWSHNMNPSDSHFDANVEQQRGALTAVNSRVFVTLGGLAGDCGSYHGYVLSFPESGSGTEQWWASTETVGGGAEGGIWAPGGASVDSGGNIYVSTGNGNQTNSGDTYDYSDAVIKLSSTAMSAGAPMDYFAPANWYDDNASDVDLGSTVPLQLPNNRVMIVGKSGIGYLLNSTSLGHIGGEIAQHRICNATNSAAFGSLAYANGDVYVGCSDGVAAVTMSLNDFSNDWYNTTNVANKPPTVAGGLVWAVASGGTHLYGLDLNTGALVSNLTITGSTHFTTPTASNGLLLVGSGSTVIAFTGCTGIPRVADFTGAGGSDVATAGSKGECVATSTGALFNDPTQWQQSAFYGTRATLTGVATTSGRADLIAVNDSSTWVAKSTGAAFSTPQQWSNVAFYGNRATLAGSVSGSGRADLVAVNSGSTWVMTSTGTGYGAPHQWSNVPFYGSRATLLADVDGDADMDLVAVNDNSTWVMLSTGSGFGAPHQWSSVAFYGSRGTVTGVIGAGGKWDLIAINSNSVWVMRSNGSGFGAPAQWSSRTFYGAQATVASDVSGDGFADIVALNHGSVWVMKSNGSVFGPAQQWYYGFPN